MRYRRSKIIEVEAIDKDDCKLIDNIMILLLGTLIVFLNNCN